MLQEKLPLVSTFSVAKVQCFSVNLQQLCGPEGRSTPGFPYTGKICWPEAAVSFSSVSFSSS